MTEVEVWERVEAAHAERYPQGCYAPGHSCEACTKRLGIVHRTQRIKVGVRRGYRGWWVTTCLDCDYRDNGR